MSETENTENVENLALIEALIFANGEPIAREVLMQVLNVDAESLTRSLDTLKQKFSASDFGFELVEVAQKFQFRTKSVFSEALKRLKESKPRRLSPAALETLAIVAYRQPIVKSDIEKIRGVDVTPTLKTLLERDLVKIVGHQATVGQPALYGTTEEFLKLFGLASLGQLPTLRDLKEIEVDPGETEQEFGTVEAGGLGE